MTDNKPPHATRSGPVGMLRNLLLQRSDLEAGGTRLAVEDCGDVAFTVPAPNCLSINPSTFYSDSAVTQVRHGLELAWLRAAMPDQPALRGVLAARVAALHQAMDCGRTESDPAVKALLDPHPGAAMLAEAWRTLAPHQRDDSAFGEADARIAEVVWPIMAPSEYLMATGNDRRLAFDPTTGLNYYGCRSRPQADIVTFSSCTASPISERGYTRAEASRRRILTDAVKTPRALEMENRRLRDELLQLFRIDDIAHAVLAPSGTDATRLMTKLIQGEHGHMPLTAIVMGLSETGTAIPDAIRGFDAVKRDDAAHDIGLATVPLRDRRGLPRAPEAIEADVRTLIAHTTADGHAILQPIDVSKTGLRAPRPAFIAQMKRQYGDRLHVVVDCCQARITPAQIRAYLEEDCAVILTGSKFYTGPPFSGAILLPRGQYDGAADTIDTDIGTLLRWAAALGEMQVFAAVPAEEKTRCLQRFGARARQRIVDNPCLMPFPGAMAASEHAASWPELQTIFTFAVRDPQAPAQFLDMTTLSSIQRWLYTDLSDLIPERVAARVCRLGQPVRLGEDAAGGTAALRLAAGARIVSGEPSHVLRRAESHIDREIADLDDVMAKIDLILAHLPRLTREQATCTAANNETGPSELGAGAQASEL